MPSSDLRVLRFSLIFVWLATAFVSAWEWQGQSVELLINVGIRDQSVAATLILGGAGLDAALGLTMWIWPGRAVYLTALSTMVAMTLAATALAPSLWLHPLGPLTKNMPMGVALWILSRARR